MRSCTFSTTTCVEKASAPSPLSRSFLVHFLGPAASTCPSVFFRVLILRVDSDPWPTDRPELVGYLLQGIREARVPLIFACAPPSAPFLPKLKDAFGEDRDVLFVDWAPQWQILAHEAVGFMVVNRCQFLS